MGQLFFKYRKIMPEEAPRGAASGVSFCLFYLSNALNLDRSRIYMSFNSANQNLCLLLTKKFVNRVTRTSHPT